MTGHHPEINLLSGAKQKETGELKNVLISAEKRGADEPLESSSDGYFPATKVPEHNAGDQADRASSLAEGTKPAAAPPNVRLRFGAFEVNPRERELRKFGLRVRLQQKPFQILERLLRTPGEFVAREELARLLWPALHVLFDRSLNTAVNALRRALGDRGRNPRFIETRPGLGYVFIAPVERVSEKTSDTRRALEPPHDSHVSPARQTNAPQAIKTPREHSQAYQEYLRGRYFADKLTEADIRKSIAYFESALALDGNYALAHAGLADTWSLAALIGGRRAGECLTQAAHWAEGALRLDDLLSEAHTASAGVRQFRDWDFAGAESSYQRALKLNPNDASARRHYARHLTIRRRFDEAIEQIGMALDLEPLSLIINMELAWIRFLSRDFSGAAEQSWKTLAIEPRFAPAQNTLGLAYEQLGMIEEAVIELDNARVCSENHPAAVAALAHGLAIASRRGDAEQMLGELKSISAGRYVSPYWLAIVYSGLGERDLAFASLEQAWRERDAWLVWLNVEPRFDALRGEERFADFVQRIGLSSGVSRPAFVR